MRTHARKPGLLAHALVLALAAGLAQAQVATPPPVPPVPPAQADPAPPVSPVPVTPEAKMGCKRMAASERTRCLKDARATYDKDLAAIKTSVNVR